MTEAQRERIESTDFYKLLQDQIGRRYLALRKGLFHDTGLAAIGRDQPSRRTVGEIHYDRRFHAHGVSGCAYNHGLPYLPARGRYAPPPGALEDRLDAPRLKFDLQRQRPSPREFLACVVQEMKVRYYQSSTVRTYRNALAKFLRWCGCTPHRLNREHVRSYLELLVNRGGSHSWIGHNLLAIRTAFDKLCGLSLTLGLEAPRKPKRLPPILSTQEVTHLLQAAPSLRDKLLLGLDLRERNEGVKVVRLRWCDRTSRSVRSPCGRAWAEGIGRSCSRLASSRSCGHKPAGPADRQPALVYVPAARVPGSSAGHVEAAGRPHADPA